MQKANIIPKIYLTILLSLLLTFSNLKGNSPLNDAFKGNNLRKLKNTGFSGVSLPVPIFVIFAIFYSGWGMFIWVAFLSLCCCYKDFYDNIENFTYFYFDTNANSIVLGIIALIYKDRIMLISFFCVLGISFICTIAFLCKFKCADLCKTEFLKEFSEYPFKLFKKCITKFNNWIIVCCPLGAYLCFGYITYFVIGLECYLMIIIFSISTGIGFYFFFLVFLLFKGIFNLFCGNCGSSGEKNEENKEPIIQNDEIADDDDLAIEHNKGAVVESYEMKA